MKGHAFFKKQELLVCLTLGQIYTLGPVNAKIKGWSVEDRLVIFALGKDHVKSLAHSFCR